MQFHDLEHQHQEVVQDLKHMKVNVVKCMKKGSVEEMRGALHRCVRKLAEGHTAHHEHVDTSTQLSVEVHHELAIEHSGRVASVVCGPGRFKTSGIEWNALWGADLLIRGWMSNRQEEGLRRASVFRGRPRPRLWYNIRSISRRHSNQPRS